MRAPFGPSLALLATALLLTATSLLGCGSGDSPSRTAAEPREELRSIPPRDRVAYYQLATTVGLLRSRLAPSSRASRAHIRSAAARIEALAPRDRTLVRARARLLARLRSGALLKAGTDVDRELARYAREHPAVAGLVPD